MEHLFNPYWSREDEDWTVEQIVAQKEKVDREWRRRNGMRTDAGQVSHQLRVGAAARVEANGDLGRIEPSADEGGRGLNVET